MNKCPFWSSKKNKVSCYSDCPMKSIEESENSCVFIEHLVGEKIEFKDIISSDKDYADGGAFSFNYLS